jgi:hypothetical protein
MPGNVKGTDLENFVRDGVLTYWHQTWTARMGRDTMSVVDGNLKAFRGIYNGVFNFHGHSLLVGGNNYWEIDFTS